VYTQYTQMPTELLLSRADGRPMYLQIVEQIRRLIAAGEWPPGQPLPSIRQLAVDLQVSVITVKRAYFELELEGLIVTQHGKGSQVASDPEVGARVNEEDLTAHLEEAVRIAALLGLGPKELQSRLREIAESFNPAGKKRA
jgi:GntR family transcriptional regulator